MSRWSGRPPTSRRHPGVHRLRVADRRSGRVPHGAPPHGPGRPGSPSSTPRPARPPHQEPPHPKNATRPRLPPRGRGATGPVPGSGSGPGPRTRTWYRTDTPAGRPAERGDRDRGQRHQRRPLGRSGRRSTTGPPPGARPASDRPRPFQARPRHARRASPVLDEHANTAAAQPCSGLAVIREVDSGQEAVTFLARRGTYGFPRRPAAGQGPRARSRCPAGRAQRPGTHKDRLSNTHGPAGSTYGPLGNAYGPSGSCGRGWRGGSRAGPSEAG
ncbi:hypothetical protein YW7DRAFT_01802 [Streptomyces sp. AmelKG-E11A]|nr:hypothetical protein YW7DRAFT_01802 [Streptomyces sp. AmelKG-E11A]